MTGINVAEAIRTNEKIEILVKVRRRLEAMRLDLLQRWKECVEPSEELLDKTAEYTMMLEFYLRLGMEVKG